LAISFNEAHVLPEAIAPGVRRQRLLDPERVRETNVTLDRLTLAAGAQITLEVPRTSLAWLLILDGEGQLAAVDKAERLSDVHAAFLPPGYRASLSSEAGLSLIFAEVSDAARFDANLSAQPPQFRLVDWTREPVLASEHDDRKRIYLVTPKLFGMSAMRGEMIIYPPGTSAPDHHHEGAEHFMYFLRGQGTAWANGKPFEVRGGDVVWYPDLERHYLKADPAEGMAFVEFFVPGVYKTIWADPSQVCTWLPTGRDIEGRIPVREIRAHSSADMVAPADV
jgi:quercetin dioxygenase-like cupin family protein